MEQSTTTAITAPDVATTAQVRSTGGPPAGDGAGAPTTSRGRRIAFRVLVTLLTLWLLALSVFGLLEVALVWLPAETVGGIVGEDDFAAFEMHRSHFMAVGVLAWATLLPVLAQLRRPERRVASMLFLVVLALASLVVFGLSGTFGEWVLEEWTWVIPVLVLAALHPRARDLLRVPGHDRAQLVLAGIAALPWAWYALDNARLQLANAAGDEHAAMEHWAIASLLGVIVVAGAVIGSSDHVGWRLPAWIAALASILVGVHSLAHPNPASGMATAWAVAAAVWGLAYAATTYSRARQEVATSDDDRTVAPATS